MILKRRFPNFMDLGPEHWTEHEVNSMEDILALEWVQRWTYNDTPLMYSMNNPYYNATKYPYGLIGISYDMVTGPSYLTIGLFTEDPSQFGLSLRPTNTKAGQGERPIR